MFIRSETTRHLRTLDGLREGRHVPRRKTCVITIVLKHYLHRPYPASLIEDGVRKQSMAQDPQHAPEMLRQMANAIRVLSMDAVQAANSGHPGMPMGMADVATVLFTQFLKYRSHRIRMARPRPLCAVAGHGSMLLYRLLYLTRLCRYHIDRLRKFRQLGAAPRAIRNTASRPVSRPPPARWVRASPMPSAWHWPSADLRAATARIPCDHYTYAIAGDGCLMEGISHEAASHGRPSQAGPPDRAVRRQRHLHRRRRTSTVRTTTIARFQAYGWARRQRRRP